MVRPEQESCARFCGRGSQGNTATLITSLTSDPAVMQVMKPVLKEQNKDHMTVLYSIWLFMFFF